MISKDKITQPDVPPNIPVDKVPGPGINNAHRKRKQNSGDKKNKYLLDKNSYYLWYKDAEAPQAQAHSSAYDNILLYQSPKDEKYQSKYTLFLWMFLLILSLPLALLIFIPQISKTFYDTREFISSHNAAIEDWPHNKPSGVKPVPPKNLTFLTPEKVERGKAPGQIDSSGSSDTAKFTYTGNVKVEENIVKEKIEKKVKKAVVEKPVYQSFEVEKAPECVNLAQVRSSIKYPPAAIESGIEGKVTVKVLVGPEGNVIKVGSVNGSDVFHDKVIDKVSKLQFTPGLQYGKPVKVWVTVPFNFKLKH